MSGTDNCASCLSVSGKQRISPGPPLFKGDYWLVDHAYPTGLLGWTVLVLLRHAEALHELTAEESKELGLLQVAVARAMREDLGCEKEYSALFAEAEGFAHVHFHLVPRSPTLPEESRGPRVFGTFMKPDIQSADPSAVIEWSGRMQPLVEKYVQELRKAT